MCGTGPEGGLHDGVAKETKQSNVSEDNKNKSYLCPRAKTHQTVMAGLNWGSG